MKVFQCQACDQPVSFESTECDSCQRRLGYVCQSHEMSALEPSGSVWHAYADPAQKYRFCANSDYHACNWLVPEDSQDRYCTSCRHNRVVPDLALDWNLTRWRQIEAAKHRLFYSLLRLDLPLMTREENPATGLAFDFLVDPAESYSVGPPVLTGHRSGLITLNIAEADDVERERRRMLFGEYYRTLLGHFRHEIGHYFWNVLVRYDPSIWAFRELFGDERASYGMALQRYYAQGAPPDWQESYVSAYATSHPWEDFAETWAHYLHIVDTVETASAFELHLRPRLRSSAPEPVVIDFDPYQSPDLDRLVSVWLPLTYAVNSLSRSMGQPALYPFKLTPAVIAKLAFVHDRVDAVRSAAGHQVDSDVLKAVITGLRQRVAPPNV
ncbi:putative zinc-binding peptidase [Methylobacterium sp. 88A]|uniref:zinc-binding metallopeptidase family protein n=1 Tax=Methylobacterium sp. 88A TaxID=1131813 RepID=UPI000375F77E|nr:putative zinc-binding peptidase [Methylobacterium sp. 88A]